MYTHALLKLKHYVSPLKYIIFARASKASEDICGGIS